MRNLFSPKKPKRKSEPMPRWLKWALIIFIGYGFLFNAYHGTPKPIENKLEEPAGKAAAENTESGDLLQIGQYKDKLFPVYTPSLQVKDKEIGKGSPAVCGQDITVAYRTSLPDGKPLENTASKEHPLTFRIGEGKIFSALEYGVIGMMPGGRRSLLSPPDMTNRLAGDNSVAIEVELLSALPAIPDLENNVFRIAQTAAGSGMLWTCGKQAKVHVVVWSAEGKKIFSTKDKNGQPVTFTIGQSEVFLGLDQGVIGMSMGAVRTLIVPPAFQKTMRGNEAAYDFRLPEKQLAIIDVEALP